MSASNQEILEKAVQRAIDGGWQSPFNLVRVVENGMLLDKFDIYLASAPGEFYLIGSTSSVIYNHDFAKALWGETPPDEMLASVNGQIGTHFARDSWQYHLMKMVIANDPIKYLGDNI